jgi:hypothetical protein
MNKDDKLIPKGTDCCDCPYWRRDSRVKVDLFGFGYIDSVWCDYLNVNTAALAFESRCERDKQKWYQAAFLDDMCKICGVM